MTNIEKKRGIISNLEKEGIDFKKDVFELSFEEKAKLAEYARKCKYRRSKGAYCGLGGSFYLHLQKIVNK